MKRIFRVSVIALFVAVGLTLPSGMLMAQCVGPCGPAACPPVPAIFAAGVCPIFPLVFTDQSTLSWPPAPAVCAPLLYDVAVGDLNCLRGSCDLGSTCAACMPLEDDDPVVGAVDATVLAPGQGAWYLVRVDADSWNSGFASQATDYNPPLVAAGLCP